MRGRAKFRSASLAGGAWPAAALLIALLIWRPGWFLALGLGLAAIAAITLLLALTVYAFAVLAPERAKKAGFRLFRHDRFRSAARSCKGASRRALFLRNSLRNAARRWGR